MEFDSFAEFLAMGKHGVYVWSSYVIFAAIILANILFPIARRRQLISRLRRIERRQAGVPMPGPADT